MRLLHTSVPVTRREPPLGPVARLHRRVRHAFTLIELLVVVTIIGVLIAMLLPSLTASRSEAQRVFCLGNMRFQYQAWVGYALDFKEQPPVIYNTQWSYPQRKIWWELLMPYVAAPGSYIRDDISETYFITQPDIKLRTMMNPTWRCPSTGGPMSGVWWNPNENGGLKRYWPCYFANNFWGLDRNGNSAGTGAWNYYHPSTGFTGPVRDWNSYNSARNGGRSIIIGESYVSWVGSHDWYSFYFDTSPVLRQSSSARLHSRKNNGLLGDGSTVSAEQSQSMVTSWHSQIHR